MKYSNLLLFLGAGVMAAQTVNWVEMGAPSARTDMGFAYDGATKSTVLFGGAGPLGDTWVWRGGWTRLAPATSPAARYGPGMAYDEAAGNLVLFGGGNGTTDFNDTWTWDGVTWTQQFPAVSPPARDRMGFAYDAAIRRVVVFGGGNASATSYLSDTWTWDGIAKTWTQQSPATSPSPRRAPMAYNAAAKTIVLFGGSIENGNVEYADTWTWNGITWTQQFPVTAPPARSDANMTYDDVLGAIVLFGGYAGSWPNSLNDTWVWEGANWKQIHPATVPHNRYGFGMDYDSVSKAVLMFGGYSSGPALGDTWLLALEP